MTISGEPARDRAASADAFAERWRTVAPAVFAWASLHVREPLRARLDPEDVLQEVACRAYEGFASFDPARGEFRAWVFAIARHVLYTALQALGTRAARAEPLDTARFESLPDTTTSVTRRIARDEGVAAFLAEVARLDDEERRLVLYRGLEGLGHEDVARLLGVSVEAATKRWLRLRERIGGKARELIAA